MVVSITHIFQILIVKCQMEHQSSIGSLSTSVQHVILCSGGGPGTNIFLLVPVI